MKGQEFPEVSIAWPPAHEKLCHDYLWRMTDGPQATSAWPFSTAITSRDQHLQET